MSNSQSTPSSASQPDVLVVEQMLDNHDHPPITIDERTMVTQPWVTVNQRRRFERYISSGVGEEQSFPIAHVPLTDCLWDVPNAALIRYGIPIKVVLVGHLLSADFHTSPGFRPVYAITVEFMRDIDHTAMADVVRRWNPEAFIPEHFKASWRAPSLRTPFRRTYDSPDRLRPVCDRQRLAFTSLAVGDVVLVETCPVLDPHGHVRFSIETVTRLALAPRSPVTPYA